MDFVDEIDTSCALSPNTRLIAFVSVPSLAGVEVPCALM